MLVLITILEITMANKQELAILIILVRLLVSDLNVTKSTSIDFFSEDGNSSKKQIISIS